MNEQKLKEAVEFYAMHHDTMRLPVEWLQYIPCRYEVYYRYSTNDGDEVANVFLYHDEKEEKYRQKEFVGNGLHPVRR